MPSKAADEAKSGWTASAWNWVHSTGSWAAAGAWNASSNTASWAKNALSNKLPDEDLLEFAKKPEVKALASDAGDLLKAAGEANIPGVVKSGTNITLKYWMPELADHRLVAGSTAGATLGGLVCGPQCAILGGVAGGLYDHLQKPKEDKDHEEGDSKASETQNAAEN